MIRHDTRPQDLEDLGLTNREAVVYLTLVDRGPLGPQAVSELGRIPRSSVYPALRALADRGLVEGAMGYGGRFRALPPAEGFHALINHQRELVDERERLAKDLADRLALSMTPGDPADEDSVETVRDERALGERFRRALTEVQDEVVNLAAAPVIVTPHGNPLVEKAMRRGVKFYAVYEKTLLDDELVRRTVARHVHAGEVARVYDGVLPMKLSLFDARTAISMMPNARRDITSLLIRNGGMGAVLRRAFDVFWHESRPYSAGE